MFISGKNYPPRKSWQKKHPSDTNYPKLGFVVHGQGGGNFQRNLNIGKRVGNDDQRTANFLKRVVPKVNIVEGGSIQT